jgi:hypothetical protein
MDTDLDFALEEIKDLLKRIKATGDKSEDHLDNGARSLGRIDDHMISLKIEVKSITEAVKKLGDMHSETASERNLGWYICGIFVLLLIHVIHHW